MIDNQKLSNAIVGMEKLSRLRRQLDDAADVMAALENGRQVAEELQSQIAARQAEIQQLKEAAIDDAVAEGKQRAGEIVEAAKAEAVRLENEAKKQRRKLEEQIVARKNELGRVTEELTAARERARAVANA